jgi:hypothetical protein
MNSSRPLHNDSDLTSLRGDPRWAALVRRLDDPLSAVPGGHAFDFWVGDWDVTNAGGQTLGTNRIERDMNGFLIREHWQSANGGEGKSFAYYILSEQRWRHIWVADNGWVTERDATPTERGVRLEGDTIDPGKPRVRSRELLERNDDGTLRQFIEQSTDGGATWTTTFDGIYRRRDASGD